MKFYTGLSIRTLGALFIPLVFSIHSCSTPGNYSGDVYVVEAFGNTLPLDSISSRIPDNMSYDDSIIMSDRIIGSWIREKVLLAQAEKSLSGSHLQFEEKINSYRNALLVSEYENQFVNSRLNRDVTEEEVQNFHESNPELFKLPEHVVRALFVHLPEEELGLDSVKIWLAEADSTSIPRLEKWSIEHNAVFAIDSDYWWFLSDLLNHIPLQIYRIEDQLKNRKVIVFTSEGRTYMLRILEHRLKDLPSPLAIAGEQIEELIIQERRRNLLDGLRDDLVKEAWSLGLISRDSLPL
jgi:hypothetical protein